MKILHTTANKQHLIEDEEEKNITTLLQTGNNSFIKLRDGSLINPKCIVEIGEPDTVPYWNGYMLEPDGRSFIRDGVKVKMETETFEEIEYKPHPKYLAMRQQLNNKLLK